MLKLLSIKVVGNGTVKKDIFLICGKYKYTLLYYSHINA